MVKVEDIYKKKNLHQHILDRPDSYIGSTKLTTEERFVFCSKENKIVKKVVEYNPGLVKIFDEILVNAIDHTVREKNAKNIKVDINVKSGEISVFNDGPGVPVVLHKEYKIYIPELIFGNLLTSSNYNDDQKRIVGGVNGLGSKCTNIFSKKFIIETVDEGAALLYQQEFSDNMFTKKEPIIKKYTKKPFTKITFLPDYEKFNMKKLTSDAVSILKKRVYDTIACTNKDVAVYLDGVKLQQKDFNSYISLYTTEKTINEKFEKDEMVWEVAAYFTETPGFVSFVNGIDTYNGGKHVEYISSQIVKKLGALIESKKKTEIKPSYIKDRLFLFVKSTIVNPSFTSQSKESLTTNIKDFGIKVELSDNFINKIYKSGIVDDILSFVKYKNEKAIVKNVDKTSRKTRLNIPKLDDANYAGTNKSKNCVLILTEGDSAKTFAISGLSVVGRDYYGVMPLKGLMLNVREATQAKILNNEETNNLKKIIGLEHGKKYTSVDALRYGKIMILSDADLDGLHVKGLVMNFIHFWWPELLEIPGFITSLRTPIIKSVKGKETIEFYSQMEYQKWCETIDASKWNIKYYKGLGTSTADEAKSLFKKLSINKMDYFSNTKKNTNDAMLLAFEKKKADDRKVWLQKTKPGEILDFSKTKMTFDDFVNKELVQFSLGDVARSIPSIYDGLKPSQRKVIYTLLSKNYKKEIKVAQFGAAVAENTAYHHGEASLFSTIINMAQDYTGSNNINLLKPNGQFGCVDPDTEILMYDGSIKCAKEIRLHDKLMGDDATPRTVLALTEGVDHMYKVTYSNGETLVVNSEHILTFKVKCHKVTKYIPNRMTWVFTYFDKDILEMKTIEYLDKDFEEPRSDVKKRKSIVLDYVDSTFRNIPNCDIFDIKVSKYLKMSSFTKSFLFAVESKKIFNFKNNFEKPKINFHEYGLYLTNKTHIPDEYKCSVVKNRFDMIAGFIQSLKSWIINDKNSLSIPVDNLNEKLVKDLQFVIKSLGLNCITIQKYLTIKNKCVYDLFMHYDCESLHYFLNEQNLTLDMEIIPIGLGRFNGWELDRNKRFLLSNYIITHNSRLQNGKDAASPRYIFTQMSDITKKIFKEVDNNILTYQKEEEMVIEPEHYIPTIPMILVNGTQGIGTGFSTFIPPYDVKDIIVNMKNYINKKPLQEMKPFYKNFKGDIVNSGQGSFTIYGTFKKLDNITLLINELPIGTSTEEYITFIKTMVETGTFLKDYINNSTEEMIDIKLKFTDEKTLDTYIKNKELVYKNLKLSRKISINNMHLFNKENKIQKYDSPLEILKEFMGIRLEYNIKRKNYLVDTYTKKIEILDQKIRFIEEIINGTLVVYRQKKEKIIEMLTSKKYKQIDGSFDYLLTLPVYAFTYEKIKELKDKKLKNQKLYDEIYSKTEKDILLDDLEELN